jgi:hypothetical protein
VKASFYTAGTEKELTSQLPPGLSFGMSLYDGPDGTTPQVTTYNKTTGVRTTLHCPYWGITPGLPVDMIFDVTIQDLTTGKLFMGDSIEVPNGAKVFGVFEPYLPAQFADGRTGTIPIKVILKPSRRRALSRNWVTQYYPGTLTFTGLSIKLVTTQTKPKDKAN